MADQKSRKCVTTISLTDTTFNDIERLGVGNSFTAKIVSIVERVKKYDGELVRYETDWQWENVSPKQINMSSIRIYIDSAQERGFVSLPENTTYLVDIYDKIFKNIPKGKITKKIMIEKIIPKIKDAGYIVQVIDDAEHAVFDVWVAKRESGCSQCNKIKEEFKKFVERIMEL